MHLIELIAALEAVKTARGNIKLADVVVVGSGDRDAIADYSDRQQRVKVHKLSIDVTGMHEEQVDELRAEHPDAEFFTRPAEASTAAGERCNVIDTAKGACSLEIGHEGDHVWQNPEALPLADQIAQDKGLPAGSVIEKDGVFIDKSGIHEVAGDGSTKPISAALAETMEAAAAKLPQRCDVWDGKGHQCIGTLGDHGDDHDFSAGVESAETITTHVPGPAVDEALEAAKQLPDAKPAE